MKVELRKISEVKPYPNNPRLNDDAVDAVAASIREYGFRQPIVVDAAGVIICGHTRFKAAQHWPRQTSQSQLAGAGIEPALPFRETGF
jgi:ParB-like chromosome segregation protein Spo0J